MGKVHEINGFVYAPGVDIDLTGTIFRYSFAVSRDGKEWVEIISNGEFSNSMNNPGPYEVHFDAHVSARYFRLTSLQEITDKKMTSIGEIKVCI